MPDQLTYQDADGIWPVVEWRVYYRHKMFCSCKGDKIEDLPASGVQGILWHIQKDGSVYCDIEAGCADDPTIYRIGGRELIGTMIPDDEFAALEERMMRVAVKRNKVLRG